MKNFFTMIFCLLATFALNAQIVFEETFEGTGLPANWTQETAATDGGWKFGTSSALSSATFPIPDNGTKVAGTNDDGCNCVKANDLLITPSIDLSTYTQVFLKFDKFYAQGTYQGVTENATIDVSTDGGATWTVVDDVTAAGDWVNNYSVDLSAYGGMSDVKIAFHYSDGGGWLYGWVIDNVSVFVPAANDVSITKVTTTRFHLQGSDVNITGEVANFGLEPLTTFDLTWSDGIADYTETVTLPSPLGYNESTTFSHTTPINLPQAVSYDFTVSVDNPNGATDSDLTNNELSGVVSGVTFIPGKKMFVEEATGTWCGWCPRGTDWMDYMADIYPDDFVGVAVHNGDPMVVTAYDGGVGDFPGFSGYPSVIVDRSEIWDPSDLEDILPDYLARIAPVAPSISATLDVATMKLTANASAEFVTQLDDLDYRLNVILAEDNVHGTGSGYNQTNYYSFQSQNLADPIAGYGLDWQDEPSSVPADKMYYNHVGRALLDGWAGGAGTVPASVVAGDVANKEYTMPNFNKDWNPYNMHAVVVVLDNATGVALNVESDHIEVICPADFGASAVVTDATGFGFGDGSIALTPPSATFGFGGYAYLWSNGETTADIEDLEVGTYTLVITDKIGCSQTLEFPVGPFSGTQDIEALASFSLTPNPASSFAVLNANFTKAVDVKVEVMNTAGQVMMVNSFDNTNNVQNTIDVTDFAEGTYLVKMSVNGQLHTERLVIAR